MGLVMMKNIVGHRPGNKFLRDYVDDSTFYLSLIWLDRGGFVSFIWFVGKFISE